MAAGKSSIKIGVVLTGDYSWAGGLYYVVNIVKTLHTLEPHKRPDIVVFYNNQTPKELLDEIKFSNVSFENLDKNAFILRVFYRLCRVLTKRNFQMEHLINPHQLNALYPLTQYSHDLRNVNCKIVYWICDFQHKFLPQLFEEKEIISRDEAFNDISKYAENIVVSSYDAVNHFNHFFPNSKAKIHTLRFVSIIDESKIISKELLKSKYEISLPYYVVANQFWTHKNHMVVFKAINKLKNEGLAFKVYFTGKQQDHRNPGYFKELLNYIEDQNIGNYVSFTGFIPREDQLSLIKNSVAVIQPSKFEGWSTVVEDCKALGKFLILSIIDVHKEQVKTNVNFFETDDFQTLSTLMKANLNYTEELNNDNYKINIDEFSGDILNVFTNLKQTK